jgi:hypothetical protein
MLRAAATAVVLAVAVAAAGCGGESEGARGDPPAAEEEDLGVAPVRGCRSRNEARFPTPDPGPGDVRIGPAYFESAASLADEGASMFTPRAGHPYVSIKMHLRVRAGTRATLVVPPAERARVGMQFAKGRPAKAPFTVANGGGAVQVRAARGHRGHARTAPPRPRSRP